MRGLAVLIVLAALGALAYFAIRQPPNAGYREVVTIATDDPRVTIATISQFGQAIEARGLGTALAQFPIESDEDGIPCDTDDLEVRTSNGVTHYPRVNLCEARWRIQLVTAVAPVPPGLKPEPSLRWMVSEIRESDYPVQALHYGVPETDGTLMTATCQRGTGRITARFTGSLEGLAGAHTARIDFYAPNGILRYDATVSNVEVAGAEEVMPFAIEQAATNVFWRDLANGVPMPYRIRGGDFLVLDATEGAETITKFVKTCSAS